MDGRGRMAVQVLELRGGARPGTAWRGIIAIDMAGQGMEGNGQRVELTRMD